MITMSSVIPSVAPCRGERKSWVPTTSAVPTIMLRKTPIAETTSSVVPKPPTILPSARMPPPTPSGPAGS